WPFWRPKPLASITVMPCKPISCSASFTSSSLKGFIIASIFFIFAPWILDGVLIGSHARPMAHRLAEAGPQQAFLGNTMNVSGLGRCGASGNRLRTPNKPKNYAECRNFRRHVWSIGSQRLAQCLRAAHGVDRAPLFIGTAT